MRFFYAFSSSIARATTVHPIKFLLLIGWTDTKHFILNVFCDILLV
nr:MAG TPA: hypothetical protein [Microviridae sp.]